jgi:hypothetical protein
MSLLNLLLGRPLASDEARVECVGPAAGIPIFGLDALSSAAYGPEAALTLLIPLGAAGSAYMVPISSPSSRSIRSHIVDGAASPYTPWSQRRELVHA